MQIHEEIGVIKKYSSWTENPNFGVASAAFLIIVFVVIIVFVGKWLLGTFDKKIDDMVKKNSREHERVMDAIVESDDKLSLQMGQIQEKQAVIVTAVNIVVRKELNGSAHEG